MEPDRVILGPLPCHDCGQSVVVVRTGYGGWRTADAADPASYHDWPCPCPTCRARRLRLVVPQPGAHVVPAMLEQA